MAELAAADCKVAALKRRLNVVHGLPSRFMQKLYRRGEPGKSLDETAQVDSPMDLELVLVPYLTASETQADELLSAAEYGSASEACLFTPPRARKFPQRSLNATQYIGKHSCMHEKCGKYLALFGFRVFVFRPFTFMLCGFRVVGLCIIGLGLRVFLSRPDSGLECSG